MTPTTWTADLTKGKPKPVTFVAIVVATEQLRPPAQPSAGQHGPDQEARANASRLKTTWNTVKVDIGSITSRAASPASAVLQ